jgi:predicted ATPase
VVLIGRAKERAALDDVVAAAREGMSGAFVLRGEAGIGKTALLDEAARSAADLTVIRIDGVESELELPYAALHRVFMSLSYARDALPPRQRLALESAFGLAPAAPPQRFMIGLATLSLLARAAADRPLLCIVDDAQWVDAPSVDALGFVARRLFADGIALLFGLREGSRRFALLESLPELALAGLDRADAE